MRIICKGRMRRSNQNEKSNGSDSKERQVNGRGMIIDLEGEGGEKVVVVR
jgi:hypothetical protein